MRKYRNALLIIAAVAAVGVGVSLNVPPGARENISGAVMTTSNYVAMVVTVGMYNPREAQAWYDNLNAQLESSMDEISEEITTP